MPVTVIVIYGCLCFFGLSLYLFYCYLKTLSCWHPLFDNLILSTLQNWYRAWEVWFWDWNFTTHEVWPNSWIAKWDCREVWLGKNNGGWQHYRAPAGKPRSLSVNKGEEELSLYAPHVTNTSWIFFLSECSIDVVIEEYCCLIPLNSFE